MPSKTQEVVVAEKKKKRAIKKPLEAKYLTKANLLERFSQTVIRAAGEEWAKEGLIYRQVDGMTKFSAQAVADMVPPKALPNFFQTCFEQEEIITKALQQKKQAKNQEK